MSKKHRWDLAYAAGDLYARCDCGWAGIRRPLPDTALGALDSPANRPVLLATEREGLAHAQDVANQDVAHQER